MKNSNRSKIDAGRTAVITGASGLLGGALATELSLNGWRLFLHGYSNASRLDALVAGLDDVAGSQCGDLADPNECKRLIDSALAALGSRIDAVIHCAGMADDSPFGQMRVDQFERVVNVNLASAIHLAKALARPFARAKSGAYILIGSIAGISGRAGGSAYAASKAGLTGLAKSLAREWAPHHIQVNVVSPGVMLDAAMAPDKATTAADALVKRSLTGEQTPMNVARFISTLLETGGISGQVLNVDGRITA
ncbi:MAG: SDR family NAD(P)-dependent oxidoreductase [Planctomycetota bacterium]